MCISDLKQICKNQNKSTKIYVDKKVDEEFANNIISQYEKLSNIFEDSGVRNILILNKPSDIKKMADEHRKISRFLQGKGKIAFGLHTKKDDTICIVQSNHKRKDEDYEGDFDVQGADTLTHEFGHSLDTKYSRCEKFKTAFLADLLELERNLLVNPKEKIEGTHMTYKEAKEYFKHYLEDVDFSDGVDKRDITRAGLRENFAETFSILFDSSESAVNDIYSSIFANSIEAVQELLSA